MEHAPPTEDTPNEDCGMEFPSVTPLTGATTLETDLLNLTVGISLGELPSEPTPKQTTDERTNERTKVRRIERNNERRTERPTFRRRTLHHKLHSLGWRRDLAWETTK